MSLTSMKRSPAEIKETAAPVDPASDEYPYGLRLSLEDEDIKRLDLDLSDLRAGSSVRLTAKATVRRFSVSDEDERGKNHSLELQITHMDLVDQDSAAAAFREAFE